jgi:hypothetical protein
MFQGASVECLVCYFDQYRLCGMSNTYLLCKISIVIPRPPRLPNVTKAVSSTVELVNSVTSNSVISFNLAM